MTDDTSDPAVVAGKGLTLCVCITTANREALVQALMDLAGVVADVRAFNSQATGGVVCVSADTRLTH